MPVAKIHANFGNILQSLETEFDRFFSGDIVVYIKKYKLNIKQNSMKIYKKNNIGRFVFLKKVIKKDNQITNGIKIEDYDLSTLLNSISFS
mgnify:CR=1 FL=1